MKSLCKKLLVGIMTFALVFSMIPPIQANAATADVPDVVGVTFEDKTVLEETGGWTNESEDGDYYCYDVYNYDYTVEFSDGTSMTREELSEYWMDSEEFGAGSYGFDFDEKYYSFEYIDNQSYENQWTAGNIYDVTVNVIVNDNNTGASSNFCEASYSVEIITLPIEEIIFEPVVKMEGTGGTWDEEWDYDGENDEDIYIGEYYRYYQTNWNYTVKFSDGTEDFVYDSDYYEYDEPGFYYNDQWITIEFTSDQSYENQWTPGNTYQVKATVGTYQTTYDVTITSIPIESIVFEPIKRNVQTKGYWSYTDYWDEETGSWKEGSYYRYYDGNYNFTVKFSDGTEDYVRTAYEDDYGDESTGFYYDDQWIPIEFTSNQSYNNQWKAGNTYKVTATAGTYQTTYDFTINESPVKYVEIDAIKILEKTNGYYSNYWEYDENTEEETLIKWYRYSFDSAGFPFTVVMKDGTRYESDSDGDIRYEDSWVHSQLIYDQSYNNQFEIGENEIYLNILGYSQPVKLIINCAEHKWDAGTVTEAATCTSKGVKTFKCTNGACKETKKELIDAKGHTPGAAATCTNPQVCTTCNTVLEQAKGHTAGADATCTTAKTCTTCGAELEKMKGHSVALTEKTRATVDEDGSIVKSCFCGTVLETVVIKSAANVSVSKATYAYDGKAKTPTVTVKDSAGAVIDAANYEVTAPKTIKNVGTYTYKIKFKGDYAGKTELKVTVNPKAPTAKKPAAAKNALTAKWGKVSAQATGYEVMVATNKAFTKNKKVVTVKSYKKTSAKVSKLKAKTKYYVKVRTYKTVKGVKYYSNWSKVKTVKTK